MVIYKAIMIHLRNARRKELAQYDVEKMCARYKKECKYLGSHQETEQEREIRLNQAKLKKRCEERFKLHI